MQHLTTQTKKSGLFMLWLVFIVSIAWSFVCKEQLNGFNELINIAGKQRALSQRMAYLLSNNEQYPQSGALLGRV